MLSRSIDSLHRLAYRTAYPVWQFYLRQLRVRTQGAQVALWNNDHLLLIRNSYRDTYTFPGGYIRNDEHTATAASRELYEETGISVKTGQLRFSFACSYNNGKHEGHDDIYECHLADRPALRIDNREVVDARFMTINTALALPLESHVYHYLKKVFACDQGTG
jgi:ADP-ribose pyrophosphatase YjhB (NUDIX family)